VTASNDGRDSAVAVLPRKEDRVMEVHALTAEHTGLARYRITMPERPGCYAILEVPADAEDPIGLVELFVGSHVRLLEWASIDGAPDGACSPEAEPGGEYTAGAYTADVPEPLRQAITMG
jgi:hypothetical protein